MDVKACADIVAARMRQQEVSPVVAIAAIFKEQHGGKGWDDEFRRAVLRELGTRGGRASAKARKTTVLRDQKRLQEMIWEAKLLAFQRRDHLVPDP